MNQHIHTAEDLKGVEAAGLTTLYPNRLKIVVGSASCGIAVGAGAVEAAAIAAIKELGLDAEVTRTGCIGFCSQEPLLDLVVPNGPRISYGNMTPEKTRSLLSAYASGKDLRLDMALAWFAGEEYILTGESHPYSPPENAVAGLPEWSSLAFYRSQKKVILRNCGSINPLSISEAIARGSYRGAMTALTGMTPEKVIEEMTKSGLRGRGGAAFPTGLKWKFASQASGETKYVVCNADEGEPGSYMDRTVLEGDPHAVLEGMLIGAFAIGAREGFIYVRSEYPLAIDTLQNAINDAEKAGLLGDDILSSGWSFRVKIRVGAGAYICGEETALLESIEGHAGEPRSRPPFPVTEGLWGKPTVVNNVKTWASVAPILTRGAGWYAAMGTERTKGTTVFSLEGAVKNAGLVEVPFGISLREMIYEIGGGVIGDRPLKALQAGGAARGCIPPSMLDLAIDMEDRPGESVMIGTGGIIALDDSACMADMARFLVGFFLDESCGKCVPCREGLRQLSGIMDRICGGSGSEADLVLLERLAGTMKAAAVCGLGGMAPGAVLATLQNFRPEFEKHIHDKSCPAGVCRCLAKK
ncbi:MAG: NADH-ubiquinone oxidoreductase-F iron-sulfur binding region domain-containing protein [Desulfuromonadaceae bacterium]|nr:NADH-ubiquinone oxidoreductase-F iron-sulfur binding region domain-containing protein [Desulfuromonadaceae bacterium]